MINYTDKQYDMVEALFDMVKTVSLKNKRSDSRYEYAWKRQISNLIFDIKGNGYSTGLVSKSALKTNKPYYVSDHVYSRGTVAEYLISKFKNKPFTLEWLQNNFPKLATTIFVTQKENGRLSFITRNMTLTQLMKMEHYIEAGIKLIHVPSKRVKKFPQLVTEQMETLVDSHSIK
jgi:hypothetical protein